MLKTLTKLFANDFKIKFENRFKGDTLERCLLVVDGTDFRRQEPYPFTKLSNGPWFTPKFKSAGFRWEVGTSIKTGDVCWFNGPFPCGMMCDLRIFRLTSKTCLRAEEKVVADKGYRGDSKVVTPLDAKNNDHRRAMSLGRARHETVNRRIKQWGALQQIWRHDNEKHAFSFRAVITIVQLEIENGRPLFQFIGYQDPLFT